MTSEQWAEATVRIATGLLGWTETKVPLNATGPEKECRWFHKDYSKLAWFGLSADGRVAFQGGEQYRIETTDWPNLTTLDGCAEFERELVNLVSRRCAYPFGRYLSILSVGGHPILATPEQRVRACLRVMEEAGL